LQLTTKKYVNVLKGELNATITLYFESSQASENFEG